MQIYHNHIPRTGGNYVRDSIRKKLVDLGKPVTPIIFTRHYDYMFNQLNKMQIEKANFVSGHFGQEPNIIMGEGFFLEVTTLRDPVMRLVSHFSSNVSLFEDLPKFNPKGPRTATNIEMFRFWIRTQNDMLSKSNFQARWLVNGLNRNLSDVPTKNGGASFLQKSYGWGVDTKEPTYEECLAKIDSMFCVGVTEKMNEFIDRFDKNFKDKFGIDLIKTDILVDEYKNETTLNLYNKLTQEDIQIIKDLNKIDMQLWEYVTNSYANA